MTVHAQLRTSKLFCDNMVLQREQPLKVWGWAPPKTKVTVSFKGQSHIAKTDQGGNWMVKLPAQQAGGPFEMTIQAKKEVIQLKNILIGDVWICSGQSNMEWTVRDTKDAGQVIKDAMDGEIRQFKVPRVGDNFQQDHLPGGEWVVCTPKTVSDFTAVGYFFAQQLRQKTGIPIGLINTSWGGSRLEPWMDFATLGYKSQEEIASRLIAENEAQNKAMKDQLVGKLGADFPLEDLGMQADKPIWAAKDLEVNNWESMSLPGIWEQSGWPMLDGVVWYRKTVDLSPEQASKAAKLGLAMVDDADITWVNGQQVGQTNGYNIVRQYELPAGLLKAGKNTIAIRVTDTGGGGGIHGEANLLCLQLGGEVIDLSGEWKYKVGKVNPVLPGYADNQMPTKLYNSMIYPMINYAIKGAIWYQGESNANNQEDAQEYATLFQQMIKGWRKDWQLGDFPFLYVQLANFMKPSTMPVESNWALLRESQSKALELPQTGQAVIIDIGEAEDIHPRNKQDVGYRLSLAARKIAYGEKELVYSGPTLKSIKIDGHQIRLQFDHVGSGLEAKGDRYGYLKGFALAGADQKFKWAQGMIKGNEVVLWSDAVDQPVAVRYAWADNPDDANLYNKEGLPASPFRTDEW